MGSARHARIAAGWDRGRMRPGRDLGDAALYPIETQWQCAPRHTGPRVVNRATSRGRLTTIEVSSCKMAKLPSAARTPQTPPPEHYEDALAELERLVGAMESGQMPLDRLLESYRRGAELLAFCRGRLEAVDAQVKVLEEGQLRPWIET